MYREEFSALRGLPHASQVLYLLMRAVMDWDTCTAGIGGEISWGGFALDLTEYPHPGVKGKKYSPDQAQRLGDWLIKGGLIGRESTKNFRDKRLILSFPLVERLKSAQKKAANKPPIEAANKPPIEKQKESLSYINFPEQAANQKSQKPPYIGIQYKDISPNGDMSGSPVGSPDAGWPAGDNEISERRAERAAQLAAGKAVLSLLNKTAGREFKPTQANLKPICGRLGEGYTPDDLALVIAHKTAQWGQDLKMAAYLQPSTLCGAQKFGGYLEAARIWERGGRTDENSSGVHQGNSKWTGNSARRTVHDEIDAAAAEANRLLRGARGGGRPN